jgi:hypothetical protein
MTCFQKHQSGKLKKLKSRLKNAPVVFSHATAAHAWQHTKYGISLELKD